MARLNPVPFLPSLVTLGNLACGVAALLWVNEAARTGDLDKLMYAGWLLVLAVILDGLDGKLARLTRGMSDLGAQLDSLADAITFGVVPAVLAVTLVHLQGPEFGIRMHPRLLVVAPILYSACAVLRLARFNVEHSDEDPSRDRDRFAGLPSPAAAGLPIALVLFWFGVADPNFVLPLGEAGIAAVRGTILRVQPFLLILLAALMVSRVPYPHLASHLTKTRRPFSVVAEAVLTLGVLLVEPELALLLATLLFVALPLIVAAQAAVRRKRSPARAEGAEGKSE